MRYVVIEGANCILAKDQPQYATIEVRAGSMIVDDGNGGTQVAPCLTLELKPDADDLQRLKDGGSLFLNILGTSWPPCSVTTYDPAAPPKGNA